MANKIERGRIFTDEEGSWEDLAEGRGVVAVALGGGKYSAWDSDDNMETPYGRNNLKQNLAGAKMYHGAGASLVTRREGGLIWLSEMEQDKQISAVVPAWKRKRFHFQQTQGTMA